MALGMSLKDLNEKMQLKRNNLMEAARYLFVEKGIANTSIDAIVRHANVAKGTFYLYFHNHMRFLWHKGKLLKIFPC